MSRIIAFRIGVGLLVLLAFLLLWSLAYEVVVALRWAPQRFPSEGASRWALFAMQNADRSADFFLVAWRHFYDRLLYPPTRTEAFIRAGYAAAAVLALGLAGALFAFINRRQMPYGAARFGHLMEAARQGLTAKRGIVLGLLSGATIRSDEPAHILVVGPSRSGKGTGFVLPNGYLWQGSAVFFDPKRENFEALANHRMAMGNKVFMFSPGSNDTHRYNPLDFVRRDERMATDCLVVASFVIPEKADDTWAGAGRLLLSALIGYVLSSPLVEGAQHMRTVARMTTTGKDISTVLRAIVRTERQHLPTWVVDSFNQYIALEPETRNSAVFNVNMAMSLWNNGLISAATETSDFDIRELRRTPMTIFIGCTIAELSIFRPLIRILFQQIHDLLMVKIPGEDEPYQVLLMLDEFYHVGRMDSLISKITISAGYGFRMAIVMQDLAQLDELYGRNTRITTVSGSQIKLFIQINDLDTSEFVSEMLGETTQVYKTPIQRPGQGIFAPRVWAPHYTPRPLRSPLELREMSPRLSILMVKNSPSFELTKIRHYLDKPYRRYFERAKGSPPELPRLPAWHDEALQGAINPAPEPAQDNGEPASVEPARTLKPKPKSRRTPSKPASKAKATPPDGEPALLLTPRRAPTHPAEPKRKELSLGAQPPAPVGENCDVREILAAAAADQSEDFVSMIDVLRAAPGSEVQEAFDTLRSLNRSFGESER
ncbi:MULTISPECIES: type IV secretory system conjugative DNA transfer family protein [Hyphomicrobiales]|uniref:type IV secretory system conjugative DNA transfer family protein n=1 Tax=Hyphomicrobiales TaxID=356 RepID=UPI0003DF0380|nr:MULTISPECIES: type IV secretory system conjugative DNA transfer family protein [Hyphomicrobiales]CAH1662821.1 Type IV secretion system protein VirD4 [Hyphomicrobiales bacterium]ETR79437.1 conjugal transfer protein TraG [Afipia sp. P52-10]MBS7743612.1 type IV secretory system conjugative DNA transfer family protein [Chelatococcus sp. HY11]MBX3546485.1 type IV secretory system conjugative DNA transfer family protein [Chelatococcus sp.]MCO5079677.1 type IV secretory system conjugative DNA tran